MFFLYRCKGKTSWGNLDVRSRHEQFYFRASIELNPVTLYMYRYRDIKHDWTQFIAQPEQYVFAPTQRQYYKSFISFQLIAQRMCRSRFARPVSSWIALYWGKPQIVIVLYASLSLHCCGLWAPGSSRLFLVRLAHKGTSYLKPTFESFGSFFCCILSLITFLHKIDSFAMYIYIDYGYDISNKKDQGAPQSVKTVLL